MGSSHEDHPQQVSKQEYERGVDGENSVLSEEGGRNLGGECVEGESLLVTIGVNLVKNPVVFTGVLSCDVKDQVRCVWYENKRGLFGVVQE